MTSSSDLVPTRPPPAALELDAAQPKDIVLLRSTYVRIGEPHGWTGRITWSADQWEAELSRPGVRVWIARIGGEVAGIVELEAKPNGDVGIVILGLVPEFVGKGFGGALLTEATRLAWALTFTEGVATKRVLVQTSSRDHPNAIANYEARGFRVFRRKQATRARVD